MKFMIFGISLLALLSYAGFADPTPKQISDDHKTFLVKALIDKYDDSTWPGLNEILTGEKKTLCFVPLTSVSENGENAMGSASWGPLPAGVYRLYAVWGEIEAAAIEVSASTENTREVSIYELDVMVEALPGGKTKTVAAVGHSEKRGGWTGTKDVFTRVDRIEVKLNNRVRLEAAYSRPPTATRVQCVAVYAVRTGDLD